MRTRVYQLRLTVTDDGYGDGGRGQFEPWQTIIDEVERLETAGLKATVTAMEWVGGVEI
jgi:hypothetical protein